MGHHDASVMTAGAAEGDRQIALALADVVRQQIDEQFRNALQKLLSLRKASDVAGHIAVLSGELLELWNIVRIRQEADVEHQIAVGGHTVAIAETVDGHHQLGLFTVPAKLLIDQLPQFVDV